MPIFILTVEAETVTDITIGGARLLEMPTVADSAALAVVRALSRLAAEDSRYLADQTATELARTRRRSA